ncbi:MAG: AI-2E family transporter [Oscillospiraceae bacterium]
MPENKHLKFLLTVAYLALGGAALWLALHFLLPWTLPFLLALLLAALLERPVTFFMDRLRLPRWAAAALCTVLLLLAVGAVLFLCVWRLWYEGSLLLGRLPSLLSALPSLGAPLERWAYRFIIAAPPQMQEPLREALEAHGVRLSRPAPGELLCAGRLESGRFLLPGDVSSQFFSGLLFALPLLSGPSELRAATPPESAGYIAMTLAALRRFGIAAEPLPDGWAIPGGQRYRSPGAVRAEGDWSNAAFWLAAGALSRPVTVTGLQAESGQGDRVILEDLRRFGAEVEQNADA